MSKYKIAPILLAAYTYDAMRIILNTAKKANIININNVTSQNYQGVTGIYIKNHHFYRSSEYAILSINPEGYKRVE